MQRYRTLSCLLLTGFLMMAAVMGGLFIPSALADPPTAPTNLTANAVSTTEIDLTWNDNSTEETGYHLERAQGSDVTPIDLPAGSHSFADTGLTQNTRYSYRVKAEKAGVDSSYTEWVTVTTDRVSYAPTGLTANASASQVVLSWTDNSSEDYFSIRRKTTGTYEEIGVVLHNVTTFTDTTINPNTTYTYVIVAIKNGNSPLTSDPLEVTTPDTAPNAPTNLNSSSITNTTVTLSWTDASSNETNFMVYCKTGSGSYSLATTLGANTTSYVDSGLTAGTAYTYKVRAINPSGYADSNEKSVTTTGGTVPSAPASLTATVISSSAIDLSWSNVSNETGYTIQRKTSSIGTYTDLVSVAANITNYSNTGLTSGTTYYYRVRAYNAAGDSAYSNVVSATPTGATIPSAPTILTATTSSSSAIYLSWSNVSNETGYTIQRKTGSSGTYTDLVSVAANTTDYSNTGLTSGTTYYYRVRAYNAAGDSTYSNVAYATTTGSSSNNVPNAAPYNLVATTYSSSKINLTWNQYSTNETDFRIERKTSSGYWSEVGTVSANVESYIDTGLSSGTIYYYRVRAHNSYGYSDYSPIDYATTSGSSSDGDVPTAPDNFAAEGYSDYIYLTWDDNSNNEDGFKIYRKSEDDNGYTLKKTTSSNVEYWSDTDVDSGLEYYYKIYAYNDEGNSDYDTVTVTASGSSYTPKAPSSLYATADSSTSVNLRWTDNSSNETGFKIERKKSGGSYTQIDTVGSGKTTYTDNDLTTGTTYYYRVRAYNSYGNSSYCTEDSVTTLSSSLSAPTSMTGYASGSSVYLSWKDNASGETGYRIERKNGSSGTYSEIGTVGSNVTRYTDTYTITGNTYYYRVRAYTSSQNSSYSSVISVTVSGSKPSGSKVLQFYIGNRAYFTNGSPQVMDSSAIIMNGRTLLPIRYVGTPLGATVDWSKADKKVTVNLGSTKVELWIGNSMAKVNGAYKLIDPTNAKVVPVIISGRTMLPIRFITENLGCDVEWNSSLQEVKITY